MNTKLDFYSSQSFDPYELLQKSHEFKKDPFSRSHLGQGKTLGMIFLQKSLRTRFSMQKAASNLGCNVLSMSADQDSWLWEFGDEAVMDQDKAEHIKEAAAVMGRYCDVLALRSFAGLNDIDADHSDYVFHRFSELCGVPLVNMESSIRHPLQSLADIMTIDELFSLSKKPRIALSWAPHVKPLPQAVAQSFLEWCKVFGLEVTVTHPKGYDLSKESMESHRYEPIQQRAINESDIVYVKNWSMTEPYGSISNDFNNWMIDEDKISLTEGPHVMHCLPVRRNLVISDSVLDSDRSLVIQEAANREWTAQAVLAKILESL